MKLKKWNIIENLNSPEIRKEYLTQVLSDGDLDEIKRALFYVSKAEGIEVVAKKAKLNRESFYKMFKEGSKPRFESIYKILQALNIKLVVAS